ncbi:MAG: L-rhamnose mutarotase [Defluviitaleaceae bacterium]|nr:L-rhamnose mutarotase [Defluviitaleaceae bacterium]
MERVTWKARIKPNQKAEYIKRHDEIWPEMTEALNEAGVHNYTIWCVGDELFGYYEAEKGRQFAADTQAASEVVAKWKVHMKDLMEMETDEQGRPKTLEQVFYHA